MIELNVDCSLIHSLSTTPQPKIWDIHLLLSTCLFSVSFFLFRYGHLDVVKYLVDGGHCQPNSKNNYGETALHYAVG